MSDFSDGSDIGSDSEVGCTSDVNETTNEVDSGDGDGVNDFDDSDAQMLQKDFEYQQEYQENEILPKEEEASSEEMADRVNNDFNKNSDIPQEKETTPPVEQENSESIQEMSSDEYANSVCEDFENDIQEETQNTSGETDETSSEVQSLEENDETSGSEKTGNESETVTEAEAIETERSDKVNNTDETADKNIETAADSNENEKEVVTETECNNEVSSTNETAEGNTEKITEETANNVEEVTETEGAEAESSEEVNSDEEPTEGNTENASDENDTEETGKKGEEVTETEGSEAVSDKAITETDDTKADSSKETDEVIAEEDAADANTSQETTESNVKTETNGTTDAGNEANADSDTSDVKTSENIDENSDSNEKNKHFENVSYQQGKNEYGYLGTCGPTSISNSLNRITEKNEYTENNVLGHAVDNNLCYKSDNPYLSGGTTTKDIVNIIDNVKNPESNIHTEVYEYDKALSVDELANRLDEPETVAIVGVDSAKLWDQRGDVSNSGLFNHSYAPSDHWITVDSPIRDENGDVSGFNVIDSGGGVSEVTRDEFEAMYMGDAGHTVSDPTAILISKGGDAANSYVTSEGVENVTNYKGSAVESDGGDPPGESDVKTAFEMKFAEKRENWVDDDKAEEFLETSHIYAQKAVNSGACSSTDNFYEMYESGDYSYSSDFVDKVKEPYLETGASSIVSNRDIMNAFDDPRCQHTIGRQEHGNFVTSMKEDSVLIYNEDGKLKSSDTIEKIKGVDPGKYDDGIYQYSYDSEFVKSCEEKGLVRTVNGDNPGSNSLNIPGCQTWAGKNINDSESELLMPSIDVKEFNSDNVFEAIRKDGYFEIKNPTVIAEDGKRVQVDGTFRIYKLGE